MVNQFAIGLETNFGSKLLTTFATRLDIRPGWGCTVVGGDECWTPLDVGGLCLDQAEFIVPA